MTTHTHTDVTRAGSPARQGAAASRPQARPPTNQQTAKYERAHCVESSVHGRDVSARAHVPNHSDRKDTGIYPSTEPNIQT